MSWVVLALSVPVFAYVAVAAVVCPDSQLSAVHPAVAGTQFCIDVPVVVAALVLLSAGLLGLSDT